MYAQLLKDIINETFTSSDMKQYLYENLQSLDKVDIVNIVRKSQVPLKRKGALFEALCQFKNKDALEADIATAREEGNMFDEEYIKEYSYLYQRESVKRALFMLESATKDTGILLLQEWETDNNTESLIGDLPFYTYEKCIAFIKNHLKDYPNDSNAENYLWHIIEKYDKDTTGELKLSYTYYLFDGEIIYYEDANSDFGSDVFGGDLRLPVPFKQGDIITCDGGPTGKETRAVILRIGDNKDCCSLTGLMKRKDGLLEYGTIKHTTSFYDFESKVLVPPLFSASLVTEGVLKDETELKRISDFVKGDEERGYIVEMAVNRLSEKEITEEWVLEREKEYNEWKQSK